ncbi:hypothetical protein OH76DRAFT_993611 [Lentinus brumalis]|uniref:Uncharacterized protein n=1 Tax=Lentinus brumalis TaxID=2498619 RepID=A0A371DQF0_9APHY|nr:hypothetical protein OH76DRAFT_993611 [Polyporus brumalis]
MPHSLLFTVTPYLDPGAFAKPQHTTFPRKGPSSEIVYLQHDLPRSCCNERTDIGLTADKFLSFLTIIDLSRPPQYMLVGFSGALTRMDDIVASCWWIFSILSEGLPRPSMLYYSFS